MLCLRGGLRVAVRGAFGFGLGLLLFPLMTFPSQVPPINLSTAVGGGFNPVMALDSQGGIDVAWIGKGVFFARSIDGGTNFATTTILQLSSPPNSVQLGVDTAGDIELLWPNPPDDTHPGGSAFFSRSIDGGVTFSPATEFAPTSGLTSSSIQLAVEPGGAIDIVWLDLPRTNLWAERSTDGGASFSAPVKVWATSGDVANLITKRGADGQLFASWTHISSSTQCDVLFSRTLDAGTTFSAAANISNTATSCSTNPLVSIDATGSLDVVWLVDNKSVWFSRSSNQGAAFTPPVQVSGGVQFFTVSDPQMAADSSGNVNVVWTGSLEQSTVFLAHSDNWGAAFGRPKILSLPPQPNNPAVTGAGSPAIGEDPCGEIFVAWSDDNPGASSGDFDVFLDRSSDNAITFSSPLNLSNTQSDPEVVSQIAVDVHGATHVLWTSVNFPQNVFYARVAPAGVPDGDFQLAVFPAELTAPQGATEQFLVGALSQGAPGESVGLSCFDLPVGATCMFNPPSLVTQFLFAPSQMTLTVPPALQPGSYVFAVSGVGTTTSSQTVELNVTAPSGMPAVRPRAMPGVARQAPSIPAPGAQLASSSQLRFAGAFGEGPHFVCRSGDDRLCGALGGGVARPRFPRSRRCRENAQPAGEVSR